MGYTHYWTPAPQEIPAEAITILSTMLEHGQKHGIIESDEKNDQHLQISEKIIWFNGVDDNAHDTFSYYPNDKWDFCKTARKPYDIYVCATLLILKYFNTSLDFNSDGGTYDDEWMKAINFLLENEKDFGLHQNLVSSLKRIRKGENKDLFVDYPLFRPNEEEEVSFTFADFCSFSLKRKEGETDQMLVCRAEFKAVSFLAENDGPPVLHDCSIPDLID